MWLQNVAEKTILSIGTDGTFYENAGNARVGKVDTRDAAAVAVAAALAGFGEASDASDVTGPALLSYHDITSKVSATGGRSTVEHGRLDGARYGSSPAQGHGHSLHICSCVTGYIRGEVVLHQAASSSRKPLGGRRGPGRRAGLASFRRRCPPRLFACRCGA
jgi:hypothetical protein